MYTAVMCMYDGKPQKGGREEGGVDNRAVCASLSLRLQIVRIVALERSFVVCGNILALSSILTADATSVLLQSTDSRRTYWALACVRKQGAAMYTFVATYVSSPCSMHSQTVIFLDDNQRHKPQTAVLPLYSRARCSDQKSLPESRPFESWSCTSSTSCHCKTAPAESAAPGDSL